MFRRAGGLGEARSRLLRALDQLFHAPALVAGKGTRLDDQHAVAHLVFVLLVVRLELLPRRHELAVLVVGEPSLHDDHPRVLHLVAGHDADQLPPPRLLAAPRALGAGPVLGLGLGDWFLCHGHFSFTGVAPARSFSPPTILTRAMSPRACRSSMVFSSWLVTRFNRFLKRSSSSLRRVLRSSSGSFPRRSLAAMPFTGSAPGPPRGSEPRACAPPDGRPGAP